MLLGEKLGWGEKRCLISILHGQQCSEQGNDRLAAANVTLQQPVHPPVATHVGEDLAYGSVLSPGETIGQMSLERGGQLAAVREPDAGPLLASDGVGAAMKDVNEQQLLESEARSATHCVGDRRRAMNHPQGIGQSRKRCVANQRLREILTNQSEQAIEMLVHYSTNHLEGQPFA